MRKQDGEIVWTVEQMLRDGQVVHVLRFERQVQGMYAGQYHPFFWTMPMMFLSNFIEPDYEHWEAYCGDELIDSNIVLINGRLATTQEKSQMEESI
jgi:hypothetical protein